MKDITSFRLLAFKALLFVILGVMAAALLLEKTPELTSLLLLAVCVWAFARAYYFLFYVLERYVDPSFRYSGVMAALRFLLGRRHRVRGDAEDAARQK